MIVEANDAHFKPLSIREWLHGPDLTYHMGRHDAKYLHRTGTLWHRGMTVMMMSSFDYTQRNLDDDASN